MKSRGLTTMPLATAFGELFPPASGFFNARCVGHINLSVRRREQETIAGFAKPLAAFPRATRDRAEHEPVLLSPTGETVRVSSRLITEPASSSARFASRGSPVRSRYVHQFLWALINLPAA